MYATSENFIIVVIPVEVIIPAVNKFAVTNRISKILPYSAINKNANSPPPYSMLKPETSSDSPSARSKGARFVSANALVNHIKNIGVIIIKNHNFSCLLAISFRLNECLAIKTVIKINAILTS